MTYPGHIEDGSIILDEPVVLPDGAKVTVSVVVSASSEPANTPLWRVAVDTGARVAREEWDSVPSDGARNLDHYLYGTPKNDE